MIDNCPKCNYALAGLPDQYRCPECGTDYDREAVAFREGKRLAGAIVTMHGLVVLGVGLLGWINHHRWLMALAGMGLLSTCLVGYRHWGREGPDGVFVSPRLIQIFRGGKLHQVDMRNVATARWSLITGKVHVYNINGIESFAFACGTWFRARRIAAQIRAFTSESKA